jgi:UDP-glucuronate 4-epimerase
MTETPPSAAASTAADPLRAATVLVTGAAGFIGFAVARALLDRGLRVVGLDNLCESYYPAALKHRRLDELEGRDGFTFTALDLSDAAGIDDLFARTRPSHVVHLAAHASVMPSFAAPLDYVRSNILGTQVLLEACRRSDRLSHLVYASTSSVYGRARERRPFTETQKLDTPISVYGASKVANEAMMQAYGDRYGLAVTGLRFFKVYGPWGRPDTVFFKFVDRVFHGEPVELHNHGDVRHAFTYIDDIVAGVVAAIARPTPARPSVPHPIYNLGNPNAEDLGRCLDLIEAALGIRAERRFVELPPGDRFFSMADIDRAARDLDYAVTTPVEVGIPRLVAWYREVCAPLDRRLVARAA